ncbi:hypothetical protein ACMFMG_006213 [Clarireedia jacksonii]
MDAGAGLDAELLYWSHFSTHLRVAQQVSSGFRSHYSLSPSSRHVALLKIYPAELVMVGLTGCECGINDKSRSMELPVERTTTHQFWQLKYDSEQRNFRKY